MTSVLITAFEPYDDWPENASWLALVALMRDLPAEGLQLTTRRYPVDYEAVRQRLADDLQAGYDYALHLGQAPGATDIRLEAVGLNLSKRHSQPAATAAVLSDDGPVAYRSALPLEAWAEKLRAARIPAQVSYHAGTFLCNATLYWSHHYAQQMKLTTRSTFVHLPLDTTQVTCADRQWASLASETSVQAIQLLLKEMVEQ